MEVLSYTFFNPRRAITAFFYVVLFIFFLAGDVFIALAARLGRAMHEGV